MTQLTDYSIRKATVEDREALARQRCAMFREMGQLSPEHEPDLVEAVLRYLTTAMPLGEYHAWAAEHDGHVVAGGGVHLRPIVPSPRWLDDELEAVVMSVWTDVEHRRCGLARRVMETILTWCEVNGAGPITLHATEPGRPLYESFGFHTANQMRLLR